MIDFVSFIGQVWFNSRHLSSHICSYFLYASEVIMIVQGILAIGGAALALVLAYIILSNFVDKFNSITISPSRQMHQSSSQNIRSTAPGQM